tara:strand:- start:7473 stop:7991 length:519 start_codon:yes stop_codon:yes gene_type:complete
MLDMNQNDISNVNKYLENVNKDNINNEIDKINNIYEEIKKLNYLIELTNFISYEELIVEGKKGLEYIDTGLEGLMNELEDIEFDKNKYCNIQINSESTLLKKIYYDDYILKKKIFYDDSTTKYIKCLKIIDFNLTNKKKLEDIYKEYHSEEFILKLIEELYKFKIKLYLYDS